MIHASAVVQVGRRRTVGPCLVHTPRVSRPSATPAFRREASTAPGAPTPPAASGCTPSSTTAPRRLARCSAPSRASASTSSPPTCSSSK
eukprot:264190-Prymnesium_polylepis.1